MTLPHPIDLGFTGTRYGMTEAQRAVLHFAMPNAVGARKAVFHHGCCDGADKEAHDIARSLGFCIEGHPGPRDDPWRVDCDVDVLHPHRTHFVRNRNIVAAADLMFATPQETEPTRKSGGTWYTIERTRKAGKPLCIVWPDGTVTRERWPNPESASVVQDGKAEAAV